MPSETDLVFIGNVVTNLLGDEQDDVVAVNIFDGPDVAPIRLTVHVDGLTASATAWLSKNEAQEVVVLLREAIEKAEQAENHRKGDSSGG